MRPAITQNQTCIFMFTKGERICFTFTWPCSSIHVATCGQGHDQKIKAMNNLIIAFCAEQ